jgi:hypothetical protein
VDDIRTWPAPVPEDDGLSLLKATLESLPRKFGRRYSLTSLFINKSNDELATDASCEAAWVHAQLHCVEGDLFNADDIGEPAVPSVDPRLN